MLRVPAILPNGSPSNDRSLDGRPPNRSPIDLGFDQLGWLRVIRHTAGTRYEVVGTVRRRPRTCAVSAATATALMGRGLRIVAVHCDGCRECTDCADVTSGQA